MRSVSRLAAAGSGVAGAGAFPLVIPWLGPQPCLDALPRELGIFVLGAALFSIVRGVKPQREQGILCALCGLGFYAPLLYWAYAAMARFGGLPAPLACWVWLLMVTYCAAFWLFLPPLFAMLRTYGRVGEATAFACALVTLEWLRSAVLLPFPWGAWGYSQARNGPCVQWASIVGVHGISLGLAYLSAWLCLNGRRALAMALMAASVGFVCGMLVDDTGVAPTRLALVQANIPQSVVNHPQSHREQIASTYGTLSRMAVHQGAEVLVWPEGAWPDLLRDDTAQVPWEAFGKPLLAGIGSFSPGAPQTLFNAAFWVDALGQVEGRYHKQRLVPFGEYVPLAHWLPIGKFVPGAVPLTAGQSSASVGAPPMGVLICYDGVFADVSRSAVRAGAEVLVNLTNDGWYGLSSAPYQHRDFYVFRAAESRRWLARATNTGISGFIDPHGRLWAQTALGQSAVTQHTVWARRDVSVYVRLGDWLLAIALGVVVGSGACLARAVLLRRASYGPT